jgi:hypothetical protein
VALGRGLEKGNKSSVAVVAHRRRRISQRPGGERFGS